MRSNSSLKQNTALKSGTTLKAKKGLSSNASLKSNTCLKSTSVLQGSVPLKSNAKLKSNVSLKSCATLKSRSVLQNNGSKLKQYTPLSSGSELTAKTQLKVKQKSAKKLSGGYKSIFGPLDVCAITGEKKQKIGKNRWSVVPHHIFGGPNKAKSELYGFILPLRVDWHTGHVYSIHEDSALDLKYKRLCQDYYINVLEKTEEEFIKDFGKWY